MSSTAMRPLLLCIIFVSILVHASGTTDIETLFDNDLSNTIARVIRNQETNQNQTTVILSEMASVLNLVVRMLQDMNECFSRPCQNRGQCVNGDNGYTCKCQAGWTGVNCEQDVDECTSAPCHNGGLCIDGVNNYTCQCLDGWTGILCEIDIVDCYSASCQNGGQCIDGVNTYTCQCTAGWTGASCETTIDECESAPCKNGGQCFDGVNNYTCQCIAGWKGNLCETTIDECTSAPCQNGGQCIDGVNNYTCQCIAGWTGNLCETTVDECASAPCKNGGQCIDGANNYTCQCIDGWTGNLCETSPTCQPGEFLCDDGSCIRNEFVCDRFPDCEHGFDEDDATCASCPYKFFCTNGRCVDLEDVCDSTDNCDDNSDEDQICIDMASPSVPGLNNTSVTLQWNEPPPKLTGTPRRNITQYAVTFTSQDSGESQVVFFPAGDDEVYTVTGLEPAMTYEIEINIVIDTEGQGEQTYRIGIPIVTVTTHIDECSSSPCQNEGQCIDGVNQFFCQCIGGWTGVSCETNIDECSSSLCQNGGLCIDGVNNYTCQCLRGWTGNQCETNPICQTDEFLCDDGSCIPNDLVCDGTADCENGTDEDVMNCTKCPYQHLCTNGRCVNLENVCDGTNDCRDNSDEVYICVDMALPSVTDVNTTSVTLQWDKPPPELTGTPRRNITQYVVTFTSQDSGVPKVMLVPAENDTVHTVAGLKPATTYKIKVNFVIDTEGQGELTYSNGVLMLNVTSAIDECSSSPCQNGGQCIDGVNQYICQCTEGWTGDSCEMNKDECASSPCTNGSKCIDGVNNYTCECIAGWTGNLCETNIDECSSVPCHNEGRCIDGVNQLTCQCVRGYTGYFCENSPTCQPGNFLCDDGRCIPGEWVCDDYPDCENGTDEEETTCAVCPFKFLCTNGRCIDLEYVCDGTNQCRDNSDEDLICVDASPPSAYAKSNPSPSSVYAKSNISTPTMSVVGALITLQWNAVRELTGNPRRNITQYVVTVTRKGGGESQVVTVPAEDDAVYTVTGLQPVTTYEIEVDVVIDTEGQGEQIYTIGIPTLTVNTTYTSTPYTISVVGALITLQWNDVRELMGNPRRNITQYVVTVTQKGDGESQVVTVPAEDDAVYTVTGLQPVTTYEIEVDVIIDTEGRGEQIYTIGIPTLSVKTTYMTAPYIESLGRKSITLKLNESTPDLIGTPQRNITQYVVTATPQGGGESRIVYIPVEGELHYMCSLEGLQPDTTYAIMVDVIINTEGQGGEQTYVDIGIPQVTATTHQPCHADLFLCYDGSCIPSNWVCDGFPDCEHGTDEEEKMCVTCPYKFLCTNGRCVDLPDVCDGTNNCEDNSDEDQICLILSTSAASVHARSITLQLNTPELTGNPQRNITQYAVTVTRQDGGQSQPVFVPAVDHTTYNATGLQPETAYVIEIDIVIDTKGQGEQTYDIGIPEVTVSTITFCLDYLGMENSDIPDGNIQSSTHYSTYVPRNARLNGNNYWLVAAAYSNPWIQADIGYQTYVSGLATQGTPSSYWTTSFKVSTFSMTTSNPEIYIRDSGASIKVFQGSTDANTIVTSTFKEPVFIRIVRITCLGNGSNGYNGIRFEVLGCKQE